MKLSTNKSPVAKIWSEKQDLVNYHIELTILDNSTGKCHKGFPLQLSNQRDLIDKLSENEVIRLGYLTAVQHEIERRALSNSLSCNAFKKKTNIRDWGADNAGTPKRQKTHRPLKGFILEENHNLLKNTILVTITHFANAPISGSPSQLLRNQALVQAMDKKHLLRLGFLQYLEEVNHYKSKEFEREKIACF